jgi:hypothetical protein
MFDENVDMFICRDIEAPLMYKDVQAVTQWERSDKVFHAITSSLSHNIPMMGGMIGFKREAKYRLSVNSWDQLTNERVDWSIKGMDQEFIGHRIYTIASQRNGDSIMQHYFYGMRNTFIDGYLTCSCPQLGTHADDCHLNIEVNIPIELKETDHLCGHIGAAGFYKGSMRQFLYKYRDMNKDLRIAESMYNPRSSGYNWDLNEPIFTWDI